MWGVFSTLAAMAPVAALLVVMLLRKMYVVGQRTCMVMERFGHFSRVVHAGVHFMPFETPKRITWGLMSDTVIDLNNCQYDQRPFQARTSDGVVVAVDGTLHYQVVDPVRAVYETQHMLKFLNDCVAQATRVVVAKNRYDDLCGRDYELAAEMVAGINEQTKDYGVECSKYMIQSIKADEVIEKSIQSHIAKQKEGAAKMHAMRQEHAQAMMKAEQDKASQLARQELENIHAEHKVAMAKLQSEVDYNRQMREGNAFAGRVKALSDVGMAHNRIVQLMYVEAIKGKDRVIMYGGNGMGNIMYPPLHGDADELVPN